MNIRVELSMTVRQVKYVTVKVPDDFDDWTNSRKNDLLSEVYSEDEGGGYFDAPDPGCEEGSHLVVGKTDKEHDYEVIAGNERAMIVVCNEHT